MQYKDDCPKLFLSYNEGSISNGIYTSISGSFDHYSDFPHTTNPETATKETLNSDVPSTYIFPLNAGKHVYTHHSTLIIS